MLDQFGWSASLSCEFIPYAQRGLVPGRVTVQQRGLCTIETDHGELAARLAGRLIHDATEGGHPVAGDWVAASARPGEGTATIHAVLPRRTAFVRKAAGIAAVPQIVAANVDVAFLVASMNANLNPRRLERYLAGAWQSGARPVVVLTKADLVADAGPAVAAIESVAFGAKILTVSAATGAGMPALAAELRPGETCVLLGSSGVGKSTLINALAGRELMATGAIRDSDALGRHTTTHRELIRLPGGALVLDTPGMRELGLIDADDGLGATFEDVETVVARCRFRDCGHTNEPGCAVREALETGMLDEARWRSFRKLERELAHLALKSDPAGRAAEHKRRVVIAKAYRSRTKQREGW